ncbi:MAG TPA: hypothetical protein DD723_02420 [Candidatus Omnitrophica bacterium]|nr:hypothetical protein [Candidatus Omnitrophota bacterium]
MAASDNNSFAQPPFTPCGDGMCDNFEKAHPDACPGDCPRPIERSVFPGGPEPDVAVSEDSPFGFHPAVPFEIARDMGIKWTRGAETPYLFWNLVDPQMKGVPGAFRWKGPLIRPDGGEGFNDFDNLFLVNKSGLAMLQNIDVQPPEPRETHFKSGSWLPTNIKAYKAFVREAVKRYSFIKYWQVGNEPNLKMKSSDYAQYQKITYQAIKEANPSVKVLIAGLAGNMDLMSINDRGYEPVLKELNGRYIDIFDIHFYGDARGGTTEFKDEKGNASRLLGYRDFKEVYEYYRGLLDENGFARVPIWVTEMGTPSGTSHLGPYVITQTEAEQARDLFKRHVYPMALGVKKIFWAFGVLEGFGEWDNDFFDHTGLIYTDRDGVHQLGEKKLGYYTYKLMAEELDGSDLSRVATVVEDDVNHVYVYKFVKDGKDIFVAWWDYFVDEAYPSTKERQVVLTGLNSARVEITEALPRFSSGQEVKDLDYKAFFNKTTVKVDHGEVSITLGENPVYVED